MSVARRFLLPTLTRTRIVFALVAAVTADALQILVGPLGWLFLDGIIDVVVMVLAVLALGFHLLLLPTFVLEFIPVVDLVPTWTGCVIAVIALRKHQQRAAQSPSRPPPQGTLPR